jgi:hypothetical protein
MTSAYQLNPGYTAENFRVKFEVIGDECKVLCKELCEVLG